ncbi:hypothetical protein MMC25_000237 [Agyrium rufum]|nr:hypothetical protein [Agyrium rufum]
MPNRRPSQQQQQQTIALMQQVTAALTQISCLPNEDSQEWEICLADARMVIRILDGSSSSSSSSSQPLTDVFDLDYQIYTISTLQKLAYKDPDHQPQRDIATWCERRWASIIQSHGEDYRAPQGLGHAWLLKSQEVLARISHEENGSSNSDTSNSFLSSTSFGGGGSQGTSRLDLPDYVQARGLLRPALDLLSRAVQLADAVDSVSGELLALAAEAYISFGNVTQPAANEQYYQQALRYLDRATRIEGYVLESHFQQYVRPFSVPPSHCIHQPQIHWTFRNVR